MNLQFFANGKARADTYGGYWQNASLSEAINKYAPGSIGIDIPDKGKLLGTATLNMIGK